MNPQTAFLEILIAAMKDAVEEGKLTQLQTTISTGLKKVKVVRIIIVPDELDFNFPTDQPLGTDAKRN